ncbi:MAG: diguanylate cyclase domain-containing protein [Xanthobacteraceae bacterium]
MISHRFSERVARFKASFGIRARLVVLALILVVPLMMDRVLVLENTRANRVEMATNELTKLAQQSAIAQREMISSIEAMLRSAAYIHSASEQTGRGCAILRASLRIEMPWISSLSVVAPSGRIACSTATNYTGLNISDAPYYQKTLESRGFVLSDLIFNPATKKPMLLANYPTAVADGETPWVIVAGINLDWMGRLMSGLGERPGTQAFLLDSKGLVLAAQPADQDAVGQPFTGAGSGPDAAGSALHTVKGVKRLTASAAIPGTDTRVVVSIDHDVMLAPINHALEKAYLQLACVSLLALIGAWFVAEQFIIRPIRLMTTMANRFGQGDLTARASGSGLPSEFRPLAVAFNFMAAQLAERERDLIANNDRLTVMASVDLVSGLANRRGFQSRLEFEWIKLHHLGSSLALMMIDVDHFKLFNDSYGHPEGDACLGRVGQALAAIAAQTQGFAARYGGEEFCLMLPGVDRARAVEVGEMVRNAVERLGIAHAMTRTGCVTVSVGVALMAPRADQSAADLIEAADAALYAAKHRGRNLVVEHDRIEVAAPALSPAI